MSATVARVLLAPGRFDAPGAAVRSALVKYAERADVVYGSELAVDLRAEAFRLPGFTQSRGTGHRGRRECAILTRDEAYQVLDVQTPELTAGGGKGRFTNPLCATTVTLRDLVSGATQVHSYCHLPAHEERGVHGVFAKGTFRTSPLLYMRAARAWAVHLAEIRAGVKPDLLVAAADWNLNGRRRWVRSLLRRIFKAAGLSTPVFPPRGTHGSRAIDGLLTDGDVESPAEVVPSGRASDHEWVLATITADTGGDIVPTDSTVRQRGTDPSGRPILASDKLWGWWEGVVWSLGFRPTVVQGAWMSRLGGGAADSAGFHDYGGCIDLRVWDLTVSQVGQVVAAIRASGRAAAWVRDRLHGGMDPHIHVVFYDDDALSTGARWQWFEYIGGRDGLASRGADYHPHPIPYPTSTPEEAYMPTAEEIAAALTAKVPTAAQIAKAVWDTEVADIDPQDRVRARVALARTNRKVTEIRKNTKPSEEPTP